MAEYHVIDIAKLRILWRQWCTNGNSPFPEELRGMTCGATTRAGTPCKQKGLYENGRCKLHGGLSTGPVTPDGKRKSASNWKKRKIFQGNKPHER